MAIRLLGITQEIMTLFISRGAVVLLIFDEILNPDSGLKC